MFLERIPECYFTAFGTLKLGAVIGPLFSAFGPEAVKDRLADSGAKVLVTAPELWARVKEIRNDLPELKHVVLVTRRQQAEPEDGVVLWDEVVGGQSDEFETVRDGPRGLLGDALHLGHDRQAEGRSARPQRDHRPVRDRQVRPRPTRRRHLLVHRRPGLGDGHLVRHVRALEQRRDEPDLRGRLQREQLVLADREVQGHRLVHRADGHPHADEGRR